MTSSRRANLFPSPFCNRRCLGYGSFDFQLTPAYRRASPQRAVKRKVVRLVEHKLKERRKVRCALVQRQNGNVTGN